MNALHVGQRQICQVNALPFRQCDQSPGHVMGLAERQAELAHQPVCKVCRRGEALCGSSAHVIRLELDRLDHAGHGAHTEVKRVEGLECQALVVLKVFRIGQRQGFHGALKTDIKARDQRRLGPDQLRCVRIALLRHDGGAGRPGIGQLGKAELRAGPEHDLFGEAREVRCGDREGRECFQRKITRRDRIQRVGHRPGKAERFGSHVTVDGKACPGQGRSAQRALVQPVCAIGKPRPVARRHLDIGQKMMPERDRLSRLQMGEARHDRVGVFPGPLDQRTLQAAKQTSRMVERATCPEAEIGNDLVIARARRVQAPGWFADQFLQPRLDIHVNIFEFAAEREGPFAHLGHNRVEPGLNGLIVFERDDAHFGQHVGMRPAAGDVFLSHAPIDIEGCVDFFHDVGWGRGKASPPHRLAFGAVHWHIPSTN